MRKQVLFIQGAGEGAYNEGEKLVASLRHLLGSPYEVHYPAMQNEDEADYKTWVRQIKEELATLNDAVLSGVVMGVGLMKAMKLWSCERTLSLSFLKMCRYFSIKAATMKSCHSRTLHYTLRGFRRQKYASSTDGATN